MLDTDDSHQFRGLLWTRLLKIVVLSFSDWILLVSIRNIGSEFSVAVVVLWLSWAPGWVTGARWPLARSDGS